MAALVTSAPLPAMLASLRAQAAGVGGLDFSSLNLSSAGGTGLSASSLDFSSLAGMIAPTAQCLEYVVGGPCCGWCPSRLIVTHYLPVLFLEVYSGFGDSVFGQTGNVTTGTRVSDHRNQTYEVRVWEIPDAVIDAAMGGQSCMLCSSQQARMAGQLTSALSQTEGSPSGGLCGSDKATMGLLGSFNKALDGLDMDCAPRLLYDTALDVLNWRTGCRDLGLNLSSAVACDSAVSGTASKLGISGLGKMDTCVGKWGSLYPRQLRSVQMADILAAAMSAYRALHISSFTLGTNPYDGSQNGKLQFVYPDASLCFHPGEPSAREIESQVQISDNGMYGFLWWVRVSCCKSVTDLSGVCVPESSVTSICGG